MVARMWVKNSGGIALARVKPAKPTEAIYIAIIVAIALFFRSLFLL